MLKDSFDTFCWLLLVVVVVSGGWLLFDNRTGHQEKRPAGTNKLLEREMANRARMELIGKLYDPIELLRKEGNAQTALLKLDELNRKYPGEAHGHILQGEILWGMGALDEGISAFVEGIKLNGDYVDAKSLLSRRADIQRLVDEGMKSVTQRSASQPDNRSLAMVRQKLNYLKSRLAGGCE